MKQLNLLVVLGWVQIFPLIMGWVGSGQSANGLGWIGSHKMHPWRDNSVQLRTSADNVALLAFAAECRPYVQQSIDYLLSLTPTAANPPRRRAAAE